MRKKLRRWLIVAVMALCAQVAATPGGKPAGLAAGQATYYPQPESAGGWRSLVKVNSAASAAEKETIRRNAGLHWDRLAEAWKYSQSFDGPHSVLIIRHGWIAGEWRNFEDARGIASCTKSLTGLAMAKLFDLSDSGRFAKRIGSDDLAWRYLPAEWAGSDPGKKRIQIRHLLTMTSGLKPYDGPYKDAEAYAQTVLSQPVEAPPGRVWAYASAPVDLLSLIIENLSGRTLRDFFNEEINAPIGVAPVEWPDFQGHTGGSGGPGGGARFKARDLARVGYLMLHNGVWNDGRGPKQVVRADRVKRITHWAPFLRRSRYRQPNFARYEANAQNYYGYLWWTNRTQQSLGAAVPSDVFYMSGFGRQACWIFPRLDMVVVRVGSNRTLNDHPEFYAEFLSRVVAAVAQGGAQGGAQ